MARARSIKPGFFKNEELAACGTEAKLLFAGLWTLADRDGRLEDRPKRIWADIFPYEPSVDVDELLTRLAEAGFVIRYEACGLRCIQIPNWRRHQNPHQKEAKGELPAPGGIVADSRMRSCYVYFIRCGKLIKIGSSRAPMARLSSLQTGNNQKLEMALCFPGSQSDERRLHRQFKHLAQNGEWFKLEAELADYVANRLSESGLATVSHSVSHISHAVVQVSHEENLVSHDFSHPQHVDTTTQVDVSQKLAMDALGDASPADSLFSDYLIPSSGGTPVLSEFELVLLETVKRLHNRHPSIRSCGPKEIQQKLRKICAKFPVARRIGVLREVDQNHEAWCESDQWQKDNGQFAKDLGNWLSPTQDRWNTQPPKMPTGKTPNYSDPKRYEFGE